MRTPSSRSASGTVNSRQTFFAAQVFCELLCLTSYTVNGCAYNEECVKHRAATAMINSHQNTISIELLITMVGAIDRGLLATRAAMPGIRPTNSGSVMRMG
jgi:hypothetical protein